MVHTYSGFEGKVKANIEERAVTLGLKDKIAQVIVPTEDVVEIKEGKKRMTTKKFFPGYVLIEMNFTEETYKLINDIPKVTGFLGDSTTPMPLTEEEVETLTKQMTSGTAIPREKNQFQKGDSIRIIDGPFLGFNGLIDEVHLEQDKVKVLVSIFGRATPVELGFYQIERL